MTKIETVECYVMTVVPDAGANLAMFDLTLNWLSNLKAFSDLNWKNVARPTNFGFVQLRQFLVCLSFKKFPG